MHKVVAVKVVRYPRSFMHHRSGRWTLKLSDGTKVKWSASVSKKGFKLKDQKEKVLGFYNTSPHPTHSYGQKKYGLRPKSAPVNSSKKQNKEKRAKSAAT